MSDTETAHVDAWPQPVRRIITSHASGSAPPTSTSSFTSADTSNPSTSKLIPTSDAPSGSHVIQHTSLVPLIPILSSSAAITPLFSHSLPTTSAPHLSTADIDEAVSAVQGVVLSGGVNGQMTELKPGVRVGMHRTSSVDYNIMVKGGAWHITPDPTVTEAGEGGRKGEKREWVGVGDVVIQRGTMHAWEAGEEGARWVCVVISAKPVVLDGKELEDVAF